MINGIKISIIAAMTPGNHVIGKDNDLPWELPSDLKKFKERTINKPVVMGRLTYESIGRPLPNRLNVVVSSRKDYQPEGVAVVSSPGAAVKLCQSYGYKDEIMVIGGSKIFDQFLIFADYLYITFVMGWYDGDRHFPNFTKENWEIIEIENHSADDKNECDYAFMTFKRKIHTQEKSLI